MDNDQVVAVNDQAAPAETAEAPKKTTRTRRKAAPKAAADVETPAAEAPAVEETPEVAEKPVRRTRARKKVEPAEPLPGLGEETPVSPEAAAETQPDAIAEAAPEKPVRRRRTAKPKVEAEEAPVAAEAAAETTTPEAGSQPDAPATAKETVPAEETVPAKETVPAEEAAPQEEVPAEEAPSAATSLFMEPVSITSMIFQAPDLTTVPRVAAVEEKDDEPEEDAESGAEGELDEGGSRRRRRSRGRRGRRGTERDENDTEDSNESGDEESPAAETLDEGVTSRRRRRRRRGDQDLELTGGTDDDPPNTVTRVRAPRPITETAPSNRVASVKGSTRLEAKKQRRRESRETGRRRQVITEAEFLARRESVDRQMIVRQRDDRIQIGVLEDGVLAEHFVSKTQQDSLIGNVYLGKVQNVLPSMEAAFVDIGRGRNAVLYAGEVNWDAVNLEGQPRRIENALKSGDSVLVQVTKDPVGHKGARLTSQISLPGRYLVYVPGGSMTGISRKLPDVERNRLKRILKDRLPENAGVIVRTAAEGASEEELTHDINRLRAQWEGIEGQASSTKVLAPELLYGEPDLTIKVVRDVFNEDFSKLIVSGDDAWDTIEAYVTYVAPDLVGRLEKWTKDQDIFAAWRIDEQIHKALERKVFLPSGGSLVIDRTEAMTVVDVNTGKFTGSGGNLEETVTKNNLEAAEEVVRQLRLRDIGGIIVIDFIDMVLESNRDLVLRRMVECLGRDRTKHQVAEVTSLGLVQMTRKRMGTGLLEVFGEQCEHCAGRGVVTHDEPVEHRRANVVAAEQHRPHTEAQQPTARTERKRRRGKGGTQGAVEAPAQVHSAPSAPAAPASHPETQDPARQAKAEATRAALATIAAAAHAAHLHDDEIHKAEEQARAAGQHAAGAVPAAATNAPVEQETAHDAAVREARSTPVLRFGGEEVALPFVEHHDEPQAAEPAMSLDRLAEAFSHLGAAPAPVEEEAVEAPKAAQASAAGEAPSASRSRRGRRNRSASRAQGAANETSVEHHEEAATPRGSAHESKAPAEPAKKPAADEPIILGVGVPASEL
ncbi:Rne/Rng family ribonuclease [Paenarthrobacter nitroguajacolicus]|uniref:Rne/Rng family ribonuclease n=1 Tax=Paenarthrobacter nitroguajacolicus TaxID=211146 RepID=UPI00248CD009|nr:Rne/Rng family ribonuclease [Paenarthrobacter nitroguajacolicus]MDI2033133.1 Ribonuclease E [Paenarthrobacter nitroguajacolicus]